MATRPTWLPRLAPLLFIGAVVGCSIWIRWPGFTHGGFANHDVGGILYNAMLLHAGELPYVASVEFKAPGTFYLATVLAGVDGTDIDRFQLWANTWGVLSLVALAAMAWRTWGPLAGCVAAVVYGLHDAWLDTMDANYVTWAQLPMVLSAAWTLASMRCDHVLGRRGGFVVAGALAACAALMKTPAGVALPLALAGACLRRDGWRDAIAVVTGAAMGFAPIVLHYMARGELGALWSGYVMNEWTYQYVATGSAMLGEDALSEGVLATIFFLALPLTLAAFAAWPPTGDRRVALVLWLWLGLTLVAASVGFRFYKGYFLAPLAPACVLAAAPWGLLGRASRLRWPVRVIAVLPLLVLVLRCWTTLDAERKNRSLPHDQGSRAIARHLNANLSEGTRIWIWGWHLWDVYAYTGRLAGTRFYKVEELITSPNDSTWRRPRTPLKFVDGEIAEVLVEELDANRPEWIVLGSAVPSRDFRALNVFLREEYVRDTKVKLNRVQFWRLKAE
jgi:hypothetical protein